MYRDPRSTKRGNKGLATNPRTRCEGKRHCFCYKHSLWAASKGARRTLSNQLTLARREDTA